MLKSRIFLLLAIPLFSNLKNIPNSHAPTVHTVTIKEMKFQPYEVTVQKGDIVVWINKDIVTHNVTEEKAKAWTSPLIASGKSWKMVINHSSSYFCSLHPVMRGKIQVR